MLDPSMIAEGMTVLDCRGKKVGWVLGVGDGKLHIGRGWISVKDYVCQVEQVINVRGDEVMLACPRDEVARAEAKEEQHYVSDGMSPGLLPEEREAPAGPGVQPARAQRRGLAGRSRILRKLWGH